MVIMSHVGDKFLQCIKENFLYQHVTGHTRIRRPDTSSLLDLIFTHTSMGTDNIIYKTPAGRSDHVKIKSEHLVK